MGQEIQFASVSTNAQEKTRGSDGRLNTSSRSNSRRYYNSRHEQETFSLVWSDSSTESTDIVLYWKNTDTAGKDLVISGVSLNAQFRADFQLLAVTGTAAGGGSAVPVCLNRASPRVANATALTAVSSPITGLTTDVIVDHISVIAGGNGQFLLQDAVRLGQDQAIAIKCLLIDTVPGTTSGTVFGYYE